MDTIVYDPARRLAERIRSERLARGWSAAELARHSKVSRAMIDKVEQARSSPTVALLGRLAGAFGLSMSTLMARAERDAYAPLVRHAEQASWKDPGSGYERRHVFPVPGSTAPVDVTAVMLPAGASIAYPASSYRLTQHLLWMLAGELTFVEGVVEHHLKAGDALELGPPQDCRFENRTGRSCRYVVIVLRVQEADRANRARYAEGVVPTSLRK